MTKRERVERAMRRQETDRVPLYDILLCDRAIEHFSGEKLPPLVNDPETRATVDRLTGKAIARMLDATRHSTFGPLEDREFTDAEGFVLHESAFAKTCWIERRPFDDVPGAAEWLKKWTAAQLAAARKAEANPRDRREQHERWFADVQARIGDTVHLYTQMGVGLDDIRHRLGFDLFAYLEADQPGLVSEALEACTRHHIALTHAIANAALSPAVLTYGDIACKGRLLHSPAWLRREFFPRLRRLNDAWHEHGFQCLFHSDGYLMEVMDDLVAAGIDGLNPLETVAGMSLRECRAKYPALFLAGGIDMSQLLSNGTPDEVRQVCRQAVRDAYPGFLMGSTTEADNSCRAENLIAMYDVAMEGIA
ncbi:MAG TPA: uroporphyrinogen decarboxylase family protein [Planctomycetota bacterium]|nr:uroporphyrinogen decarboxylase family protein [Planctomycetota bacterium]HRR82510.1 uroporphyrinogen decarboxylase family protein [Planctomycetota bacterium]HRT96934.1 uroporphyrinogen decarboxylase family protein [Planctomycetota bacterium]